MQDGRRKYLPPFVLIVEDDPAQTEFLRRNLSLEGLNSAVVSRGDDAMDLIVEMRPDIVVMDAMSANCAEHVIVRRPGVGGNSNESPVVFVATRDGLLMRDTSFEAGADSHVVATPSSNRLIATIKSILCRRYSNVISGRLEYGGVVMDLETHRVRRSGRLIRLGPTEFRLLQALLSRPAKVFLRRELVELVWGTKAGVKFRTVDVHIRRLRKALSVAEEFDLIRTVRGIGYAMDVELET